MADITFDDLHFTESFLSVPHLEDGDLIVEVKQMYVPRADNPRVDEARSGRLRFCGAARSERTLYEYKGDPKSGRGFKPARTVLDIDIRQEGPLTQYLFGGVHLEPAPAWVEWCVLARDFQLTLD